MKFRFRKTNDNQHEREIVLKSEFQINVDDILKSWAEEWSETPETCTQKWKLREIPVLADGTIALLFEYPVNYYEGRVDNFEEHVVTNYYRVLVYDPKKKKLIGKYRFSVYWGFATTVFFKNGCLYAVITVFSDDTTYGFTALHMWPGADDEHQIYLGENVTCALARSNGDIIACYDEESALEADEREFAGVIAPADGKISRIPCIPDLNRGKKRCIRHFTFDIDERMWALLYDMHTVVRFEKDGSITKRWIPCLYAEAITLPDDKKGVFAIVEERSDYSLNYIPMNGQEFENKSYKCVIRTETGDKSGFIYYSMCKNIAALQADNMVYIVDLNRRARTWFN